MKNNTSGIAGKKFQLKMKPIYTLYSHNMLVLEDPVPYRKENKSKWGIVNWYRKLTCTYYESGYKYTVKIIR